MRGKILFLLTWLLIAVKLSDAQIPYPGESPGAAKIKILPDNSVILENKVLRIEFAQDGNNLTIRGFEDKSSGRQLLIGKTDLFELTLGDNSVITSREFTLLNPPSTSAITPDLKAARYSEKLGGKRCEADFENKEIGLLVHWTAELKEDANYVRQVFTFIARDTVKISKITLIKLPVNIGVRKEGKVDGSLMVHKNMFFAIEHPMGLIGQNQQSWVASLLNFNPVTSTNSYTASTVWGVTPANQLRRGVLYYIERERSMPYRQMLHYNSWWDISWIDGKFTESQALDRIRMFRDSLIIKRHVRLNAFLFDDGWDDNKTLWRFDTTALPNGFGKMKEMAESCESSLGVWISPWGGYSPNKEERIKFGNSQDPPFETNANGFSLAGPVYYKRFLDVTKNFIKESNISMFKFDGVGAGNKVSGAGIAYHNDIEAYLRLLKDLKKMKPDLYLDLTAGTWPSVFWLLYGDNIWRSDDDYSFAGEGSKRQKGITYRDAMTYKNVVKAGPLYPLNSLMNIGVVIADNGIAGTVEMDDKDISDDIWSFFGTGVNLQELYINPHKLNTANWNCLATASKWARKNERIMPDIHWVGGDPAKNEVYGYAAWSPRGAILMIRNPSKELKTFKVNVADVFELPAKGDYLFYDAKTGSKDPKMKGSSFSITLQPFEVKVFESSRKN
ncbi:MAG: hypothetical protein M0Q53_09520 [Prolixibacteraceae bacterium]|jgi:hypothetical protein|nr:hypothetical protein [Prolixibacteraceae bacterium]